MNIQSGKLEPHITSDIIASLFLQTAEGFRPANFRAFMEGTVAKVLDALSDEYFNDMMDVKPCRKPGCDCHIVAKQVMEAYKALKESWCKELKKDDGSETSHPE